MPAAFSCRAMPVDIEATADADAHVRRLLSIPGTARRFVEFTCGPGQFSEMATLMLQVGPGRILAKCPSTRS